MKCRLFDALVEPVLSYASHVWGPELFSAGKLAAASMPSSADKVHTNFLRMMAGVGKVTCTDVLLRDFARHPVMHHWVVLAVRWFAKLGAMSPDRMAHHAWLQDIALMMSGCQKCWTFQVLSTLSSLHLLERAAWDALLPDSSITSEDIQRICVHESEVKEALKKLSLSRWAGCHLDPRSSPSLGVERCTHAAWVWPLPHMGTTGGGRPKHLHLCMSFKMLQCLARFRMGWHHLQIQVGRKDRVPRANRHCKLCSVVGGPFHVLEDGGQPCVEDLMHFMLECPAYANIRLQFPNVFADTAAVAPAGARMCAMFACDHQQQLAVCIHTMDVHRSQLLRGTVRAANGTT
jgi:hypothetical protein